MLQTKFHSLCSTTTIKVSVGLDKMSVCCIRLHTLKFPGIFLVVLVQRLLPNQTKPSSGWLSSVKINMNTHTHTLEADIYVGATIYFDKNHFLIMIIAECLGYKHCLGLLFKLRDLLWT